MESCSFSIACLLPRALDSSSARVKRFLLSQLDQRDFTCGWLDSDQVANPYAPEFSEKRNQKPKIEWHSNSPNRRQACPYHHCNLPVWVFCLSFTLPSQSHWIKRTVNRE